jgi:hypothetical protein
MIALLSITKTSLPQSGFVCGTIEVWPRPIAEAFIIVANILFIRVVSSNLDPVSVCPS